MKNVVGVVVGGLLALAIACGGAAPQRIDSPPRPRDARAELERLDQEITAQMQQLNEPRPAPPVDACVENCKQPMATQAQTARATTCEESKSETCKQSCTLKASICENAGKICTLAADLGGTDAYANEVCNRGLASCEAAKTRCCSCM